MVSQASKIAWLPIRRPNFDLNAAHHSGHRIVNQRHYQTCKCSAYSIYKGTPENRKERVNGVRGPVA
jgi:hypothetical protein